MRTKHFLEIATRVFWRNINAIPNSSHSFRVNYIIIIPSLLIIVFISFLFFSDTFSNTKIISSFVSSTSHETGSATSTLIEYLHFLQSIHSEIPENINFLPGKQTCIECPFTENDLNKHINYEEESSKLQKLKTVHEMVWRYILENHKSISDTKNPNPGVVILGGGKYSMMSLLSIESLRLYGSQLPLELIIPSKEEYDPYLCETIIAESLNGKCLVMEDIIGSNLWSLLNIKSYQLKPLALLLSTFQEIIYFDSDNIPVTNIDKWFESESYLTNGLITWPDFWSRGTSGWFYKVAGLEVDRGVKVREGRWPLSEPVSLDDASQTPFHDLKGTLPDPSTESGCLLVNKSSHSKTLLLSLFYNTYGPQVFYELISQGQWGQGDKETYMFASLKAGDGWWQVKSKIQRIGISILKGGDFDSDKRIFGDWFEVTKGYSIKTTAMAQADLVDDYEEYSRVLNENGGNFRDNFIDSERKLGLIHANHPKMDPVALANKFEGSLTNGKHYRIFDSLSERLQTQNKFSKVVGGVSYDFELIQFKNLWKYSGCLNIEKNDENGFTLKYLEPLVDQLPQICEYLAKHINFLETSPLIRES